MFHIITTKRLKEFYSKYPDSQTALTAWSKITSLAEWENPAQLRETFSNADFVENLTVFNVGGNKYRLIAYIDYEYRKIFIRAVLTHTEYDTDKWKNDPWFK
jgi:mRNA interferase HigB